MPTKVFIPISALDGGTDADASADAGAGPHNLLALARLASDVARSSGVTTTEEEEKARPNYSNSTTEPAGAGAAIESKKKKQGRSVGSKSTKKVIKKRSYKPGFIDLTDVPSQPLILKNDLSNTDYKDNSRRRNVKPGSSKYTGLYFDKGMKKWKAQIMVDGKVRSIGYYEKEEGAAADYARAAFKYKTKNSSEEGGKLYGGFDLSSIPEQPLIRSRTNKTNGYRGVKKMRSRWQARISAPKGKHVTLGTFDTAEEAAGIYARAAYYLERKGGIEGLGEMKLPVLQPVTNNHINVNSEYKDGCVGDGGYATSSCHSNHSSMKMAAVESGSPGERLPCQPGGFSRVRMGLDGDEAHAKSDGNSQGLVHVTDCEGGGPVVMEAV